MISRISAFFGCAGPDSTTLWSGCTELTCGVHPANNPAGSAHQPWLTCQRWRCLAAAAAVQQPPLLRGVAWRPERRTEGLSAGKIVACRSMVKYNLLPNGVEDAARSSAELIMSYTNMSPSVSTHFSKANPSSSVVRSHHSIAIAMSPSVNIVPLISSRRFVACLTTPLPRKWSMPASTTRPTQ